MATGTDLKGILSLNKFQEERDQIALNKFIAKNQKDITKIRPKGVSREVFALMTEEDLIKLHNEGGPVADKKVADGDGSDKDGAEAEVSTAKKDYLKLLKHI
jgi:hypothetical protein